MTFKRQRNVEIGWDSDFAYAVGVTASDGYLTKDNSYVRFNLKDLELVENVKKAFKVNNKISYYSPKDRDCGWYSLEIGDRNFCDFLISIGIQNKKSNTIKKVEIPPEYFADFCRGLFDGDGTFYSSWDKRRRSSLRISTTFYSASKSFLFWLKSNLNKFYGLEGSIRSGDRVFRLSYGKKFTLKLFKVMYHSSDLLFLKRKYYKMVDAFTKDPNLSFDLKEFSNCKNPNSYKSAASN